MSGKDTALFASALGYTIRDGPDGVRIDRIGAAAPARRPLAHTLWAERQRNYEH